MARGRAVHIRDAVEADLGAIVEIYNASIPGRRATADTEPVTVESRRTWFESHSPTRRPVWVAEAEDAIAGWLSFSNFYGRPAYHATAEISVYVAPAHQGRGIGRALLAEAVRRGREFGLRTLLGFIFGHNESSLRLFEGLGFARWGHLPGVAELDGIERDLVILGLLIADGRSVAACRAI